MEVILSLGAQAELRTLSPREADAMLIALEKLRTLGDQLRFPHSSAVKGAEATCGSCGREAGGALGALSTGASATG